MGPHAKRCRFKTIGSAVEKYKQIVMAEFEIWMEWGVVNIFWNVCFL